MKSKFTYFCNMTCTFFVFINNIGSGQTTMPNLLLQFLDPPLKLKTACRFSSFISKTPLATISTVCMPCHNITVAELRGGLEGPRGAWATPIKNIKTYLRTTMTEQRLTDISILSIERELSKKISLDTVVSKFEGIDKNRSIVLC